MFLSDQRLLSVSPGVAQVRLANLAQSGWLDEASEAAYRGGIDHLLRVGPFGDLPGLSRRVWVQFLEPVDRDGTVSFGMRWETTGVTGRLFPVLDADITLTGEAGQATRMTLTGAYRPPLGALGAGLDRLLLHRIATATIHSLITRLTEAIEGTAAPAPAAGSPVAWEPGPESAPDWT